MYELQILTIVFMIVSFASVWSSIKFNEIPLWVIPFGITIILGVFSGALSPLSLVWIGLSNSTWVFHSGFGDELASWFQ